MKSYADRNVNGVNVPLSSVADTNTAINAIANGVVRQAIVKAVKRSAAADCRLIEDAADEAVRTTLASFGIIV